ncbi:MAG TPA: tetratricopeptide repeat protein, partial [Planctomycetota bacterium]|nr:tetratricopeptide repeat protein [Planctomycetota bacterium]
MVDYSKHLQKADEALRRRNYDFAVEVYQQLLEIDPDLAEARAGLRSAYSKRFEAKKGGSRFLRAIGGAGPLAMAKTLRKAGKNDAAAKALESYLANSPMDEDANLMLGMALEDAGHTRSALAVYEFLAEIAPRNPQGLKRAGAMAWRGGDPRRALEFYERALQADPRDQDALKARKDLAADIALSKGRYEEVEHSRQQIVNQDEAVSLERSQRRHMSAEDLVSERERLEGLFAENASDVEVMTQLGEVHEKLRDYEAALELVERALSYKQDSFELLEKAGDLRSKVLKKSIARADKAGEAAQAGELEAELARHEVDDYRARVALHPGDASLRVQLAWRLMRADDIDGALAELQKANSDPRLRRESLFLMAQCFQRKGFTDLARKEYE